MKAINIWDNNHIYKFTYYNTIEELIENLKKRKTTNIEIKNEYIPGSRVTLSEESIFLNQDLKVTYTDENHPACKTGLFKGTIVDPAFFEKHKDIIIETLRENALNSKSVTIDKYTYSDDLIKQIIENDDEVQITFKEITPSSPIIDLLREKHIESFLETNNERKILSTKYAISYYTFKDLETLSKITISSSITDEEIYNLKYCRENMIINIKNDNEEPEFLTNVKRILDSIEDRNIIIKFESNKRSNLEKSGILNLNFTNLKIIINNDLYDYPFEEYKNEEEKLNNMVENIKNSDMTPFEKYIAVYNIVKNYKKYNENEENKNQSRYLRHILDNDYMVCVGYAKLLQTLLDKVGIDSIDYSPQVDISYDKGFTEEEIPLEHAGHARLMVNIQDEKYGIDGFYITDPTWDNDLENDLYGNLLMPMDYMQKSNRLFKLQDLDYIFDVHNLEEYKTKISTLIRKKLTKITPPPKDKFDSNKYSPFQINEKIEQYYKKDILNSLSLIYDKIINTIKNLDYNKYLELKNDYSNTFESFPIIDSIDTINKKIDYYYDFFAKIGPYIVSKSNKEVSKSTIANAITNTKLKQGLLLPQNVEEYRELLEENLETQDLKNRPYEFPDNYLSETDDGITINPKKK